MIETSELVIAIVTPVGSRRDELIGAIELALRAVHFQMIRIRLSGLLERASKVWTAPDGNSEATRIRHLQEIGNRFRKSTGDPTAVARAALVAIREKRGEITSDPDKPAVRVAYVLDQLKNPSEVELLREIYGSCFFLIAGHAPKSLRESGLAAVIARSKGHASEIESSLDDARAIIRDDDTQNDEHGQNTRDAYPKADLFVDIGIEGGAGAEVNRFIELIFGHPFHTPTQSEYAMHQASAASLRSSDESRQVGAAIVTDDGDVIAVGTNEAPLRGGGLYWPSQSPDARDQNLIRRGDDRAANIKASALRELLERLHDQNMLAPSNEAANEQARKLLPYLKGTQFMNIGEFGRTVHAEMAALVDAAKRGVSVDKQMMYVTTFPCHNCAKHIIASGIKEVLYLEPYPKSHAGFLHWEEIELDPTPGHRYPDKLLFHRFSGIAPRQYEQLFGMSRRGAKKGLSLGDWYEERAILLPTYTERNASLAYLAAECEELESLSDSNFAWDKSAICPKNSKAVC